MENKNELILHVENLGMALEQKKQLLSIFNPFFEQAKEWAEKSKDLVVTDESQLELIAETGIARKAIKNIRVSIEHKRKELKEESLRTGQNIDAVAKMLTSFIEPTEKHLLEQEKFVENKEKERKQKLKMERLNQLHDVDVDGSWYDLDNMPEDAFQVLLTNSITAYEHKKEKEEECRIEQERFERERKLAAIEEENNRIRERAEAKKEQERLQAEKELVQNELDFVNEQKAKAESEANAKLETERLERLKVENELKALKEKEESIAEAKRLSVELDLRKDDSQKIESIINDFEDLKTKYVFKSAKNKQMHIEVNTLIDKVISHIKLKTNG